MKEERWGDIGSKSSHLTSVHPCYNEKMHFKTARIHLPVAPKCNIQCGYCVRRIDKCEHRPGVSSGIINPQEALERVDKYVKEMDNLKVVGIAGPAESLANDATFETLRMVHEKYPELIECIASNGLLLSEKIDELKAVGVNSVTVTVNAVNPETAAKIYKWVQYHDKTYKGLEAAELLLEKQWEGIKAAVEAGLVVKINTVLLPEINKDEIEDIAKKGAEYGAFIMNIIPLIPLYDFEDSEPPTCDDLKEVRELAGKYLPQFRLCQQCRADAVGVPGAEPCGSPVQKRAQGEYFHG
ncbi:MAG: FeMo cofactor biosynthesis protein NifB [ANME-2 cluster archaeon]|nr:FeMo cofactor biosynthesis protein NifB [ANME-2 cluster archaeon]